MERSIKAIDVEMEINYDQALVREGKVKESFIDDAGHTYYVSVSSQAIQTIILKN